MKAIRNSLATLIFIAVLALQSIAADYEIDKSKSTIKWNGKKVTGEHYGTISLNNGYLKVENNKLISGLVEMDMNSIVVEDLKNESSNKKLTGHLKSDDFFSVDKHPKARLEIKNAVKKAGNNYSVTGDLTIKEITHPVTFDAVLNIGNGKLTSKGKVEVDRTLYDIKFRSGKFFSDLGDNLIFDTFTLDFDVVANEAGKATTAIK